MKQLETIIEIKNKLHIGKKLNISESDIILSIINKYEFCIKNATEIHDNLIEKTNELKYNEKIIEVDERHLTFKQVYEEIILLYEKME